MDYSRLIKRWLPKGWKHVEQVQRAQWHSGLASRDKDGKIIYTEPVRNPEGAFTFLHECGHVRLGHFEHNLPRHVEEYQAERFAIMALGLEGEKVPKGWLADAKQQVRVCVADDRRHGIPISKLVARWCGAKTEDEQSLDPPAPVYGSQKTFPSVPRRTKSPGNLP